MDASGLRRRSFCLGLAATIVGAARPAGASFDMPPALQADLMVKLAPYDRGLRARAGDVVDVVLVTRPGDADSERSAAQLAASLGRVARIADLPHRETVVGYAGGSELAARCKQLRAAIVHVSPQLAPVGDAIRTALDGVNVLTVAPSVELVRRAVVLGFDLVSSKPKLFFNAGLAKRQGIVLASEVLKLMTVFP